MAELQGLDGHFAAHTVEVGHGVAHGPGVDEGPGGAFAARVVDQADGHIVALHARGARIVRRRDGVEPVHEIAVVGNAPAEGDIAELGEARQLAGRVAQVIAFTVFHSVHGGAHAGHFGETRAADTFDFDRVSKYSIKFLGRNIFLLIAILAQRKNRPYILAGR